jgi:hypothetical protein
LDFTDAGLKTRGRDWEMDFEVVDYWFGLKKVHGFISLIVLCLSIFTIFNKSLQFYLLLKP